MTYEPNGLTTPSSQLYTHHEGSIEERKQKQNDILKAKKEECEARLSTQSYQPG